MSSRLLLSLVAAVFAASFLLSNTAFSQSHELNVASFNVRYDNPSDTLLWVDRHREVAGAVMYNELIGFQEVLPNQYEDLVQSLADFDSYGIGRDGMGEGEASPIFWRRDRFDLLHTETRWLGDTPHLPGSIAKGAELPRVVTIVLLLDRQSGLKLRVLNTHWSHVSEEARLHSAAQLTGWCGLSTDEVVVLIGDLNAEPHETAYLQLLEGAALSDTYDIARYRCRRSFGTMPGFDPAAGKNIKRIDYILVRGTEVEWVCADENVKWGLYISDHLPVHAVLKLRSL